LAADHPGFSGIPRLPNTNHGLVPADWGLIVYDENQGVCWLANANLAGDPLVRAAMEVAGINPDGTMDYATALLWVDAMNSFDHGHGVLGHNNWQLPSTPQFDPTSCSSSGKWRKYSSFGFAAGSKRNNTAFMALKIAVVAPIPRASVSTVVAAKIGALCNCRSA
jgi:hypothetical protein